MCSKEIIAHERAKKVEKMLSEFWDGKAIAYESAYNDYVKLKTNFDGCLDLYTCACLAHYGHKNICELNEKILDSFLNKNTDFKSVKDLEVKFNLYYKQNKGA